MTRPHHVYSLVWRAVALATLGLAACGGGESAPANQDELNKLLEDGELALPLRRALTMPPVPGPGAGGRADRARRTPADRRPGPAAVPARPTAASWSTAASSSMAAASAAPAA